MTSLAVNPIIANPPLRTRTRFLKGVKSPNLNMLKSGGNNKKLGARIKAKMWKGMPLYSLSLEERATCPTTCEQWDNCYGDNMPFAHRFDHTHPDFIPMLEAQIDALSTKNPEGFVVRLHVLGDFYDTQYITQWQMWLQKYKALNAFGYTHHRITSERGKRLNTLNSLFSERFRIRFSDDNTTEFSAHVIAANKPSAAIGVLCPEQTGRTTSCATCGFCWTSERPVLFIEH